MVTVIGAGNGGVSIACYLEERGFKTTIWNRSIDRLEKILENDNTICIKDNVTKNDKKIKISNVTNNLEEAICNNKYIIIVTPGIAHREIAKNISKYLTEEHVIILMPGRTYSCIEFMEIIKSNIQISPICIETQTILHACRSNGNNLEIFGVKSKVLYSANQLIGEEIINSLKELLPDFQYVENYFDVTLNNIGALLHPIPTILNAARIESGVRFKYYSEGITPVVADYIQRIDDEREKVCNKIGCYFISLMDWLKKEYGATGNSVYECINTIDAYKNIDAPNTLNHRYIFDDINTGLVPLYYTGKSLDIDMNSTKSFVEFASILMQYNFWENGRKVNREMF